MSSLTSRLGSHPRALAAIAIGLLVALVAATAGAVYAYEQAQPTTTSFNLKPDAKEVRLDEPLTFTFSRPLSSATAAERHFHLAPAIDGVLKASADRRAFTWTPTGPWADLTTYVATVDAFKDAGHDVRGARVSYTTTIVPRVVAVTTGGAGVADGGAIPLGTKLTIAFNTAMDAASVQLTANGAAAKLAWAGDSKSAVLDTTGSKVGQLALALQPGGKDALGHTLGTDWKLALNLVFKVNVHTTPLKYPALIQVPDDPTARDQSGLQSADMVFEYATEGNIPRFTALFTNAPDKVGPVRSARLVSIKLTRHYRGQLFLSGMSSGTFGVLLRDGVPTFFDTQGYYYRSSDRYAPNNLYINADAIARAETYNLPAQKIATGAPNLPAGSPGTHAEVAQNGSAYNYDDTTRTYTKTQDGHLMSDAAIGQPLRISMLVVMHTAVTTTGIIEDVNGAHGLDYDLESGGRADFYYQGQAYSGKWSAADRSSPFTFALDNGTQVPVPPGLVWVDVVP